MARTIGAKNKKKKLPYGNSVSLKIEEINKEDVPQKPIKQKTKEENSLGIIKLVLSNEDLSDFEKICSIRFITQLY